MKKTCSFLHRPNLLRAPAVPPLFQSEHSDWFAFFPILLPSPINTCCNLHTTFSAREEQQQQLVENGRDG
ncbi:hypothetical protein Mapa_000550 [Marchantia paleacea]|nr:hypothetical protein Mapa_000550 [Marchantia paleacea]